MTTIRRAAEQDAREVHRLIELLESPQKFQFERFHQKYLAKLADPNVVYLVAEGEGDLASFGSMQFTDPLHHEGPVAEIMELVVDERCRGGGLGARMIAAMKELACQRGCCILELSTNRVRRQAHRFYLRQGFMMTHLRFTMALDIGEPMR